MVIIGGKSRTCYKQLNINLLSSINKKLGRNMDNSTGPDFHYARLSEESGTWRIFWYNRNTDGQLTRVRKTFELNRIADLTTRRAKAGKYIALINEALAAGWNYFTDLDITQPKKSVRTTQPVITVAAAVAQAQRLRAIGVSGRTLSSYNSNANTFTAWLALCGLATQPVTAFTTLHFYDYIHHKKSLGHGNANINEQCIYLKSLFKIMADKLHLITTNPISIESLPEGESTKFVPLTPDEIEKIVPALIAYNPRYYLFCKFVADEFIRPHHIARLKAGQISYGTDEITLGGDTTKSKKNTTKQLIKGMKDTLLQMECDKIPGNYYLFTKNFEPGRQLYPRLSITAAEVWKKLVIDGLGINKQLYALKHTSAQYFVNNNAQVDVYYLRQQLEHSTAAMTEIYLQKNVKKRVKDGDVNTLKF